MYIRPQTAIPDLIRKAYRLFPDLPSLASSFLQLCLRISHFQRGSICLKTAAFLNSGEDNQVFIFSDGEFKPSHEATTERCRGCISFYEHGCTGVTIVRGSSAEGLCVGPVSADCEVMLLPIKYQRQLVGVMTLASNQPPFSRSQAKDCQLIANEFVYHLKRYEFRRLVQEKLGRDISLIGASEAMRSSDRFVEKASQVDLPIMITSEIGCEKKQFACAIHVGSSRCEAPLVSVNCSALDTQMSGKELFELFAKAHRGTILLHYIDELPMKLQYYLLDIIESRSCRAIGERDAAVDVRLIATANRSHSELTSDRKICPSLLRELNFVDTWIAPLRERKEDIKHLIDYFLEKPGLRQSHTISEEVLKLCEQYDWPQNDNELAHVIARLAVMAEDEVITLRDLKAFAPAVLERARNLSPEVGAKHRTLHFESGPFSEELVDTRVIRLANNLINREYGELRGLHSSVRKVLEYLSDNFDDKISLRHLASQACLSSSHLSYLLNKNFGVSFKTLLAIMRIEKAKQLLIERPDLRVTEISTGIGYDELSHFERTFKRLVHCTPREFRHRSLLSSR
jgi:DNA-binding NtrC family response regulator